MPTSRCGEAVSDPREPELPVFGRYRLETIRKADGRELHLYTWPEAPHPGEPDVRPAPPAEGGDPRQGPDSEEQPGV